ncbi:cation diffusion facilitator family transporter [uncultured Rubinisphaera sp.]|uniref:cation diffusion facilitator family transporter n=1 Tax=uncultured Rubinisphaera sp. TaxID=1678686 RepID=UPI0030D98587
MHDHGPHQFHYDRAFRWGVIFNVVYVLVEAGYGLKVGSLALLSDAGHNLSDVFGLLLAWSGHALSKIPANPKRTYGYQGATILAALFNALILLMATGGIVWEAISRLQTPATPDSMTVIVVAGIGVVVNVATALLFMKGHDDLNVRGAYLHMAADAGVSVGVVIGGIVIMFTGWSMIDPILSLIIAAFIFWGTWGLLTESVNLAMQAVPKQIDSQAVAKFLSSTDGVTGIHDLHIWAMSTTEIALTAHLVRPEHHQEDAFLHNLGHELESKFGIHHTTIQIEHSHNNKACSQHNSCNTYSKEPSME